MLDPQLSAALELEERAGAGAWSPVQLGQLVRPHAMTVGGLLVAQVVLQQMQLEAQRAAQEQWQQLTAAASAPEPERPVLAAVPGQYL